MFSTLGRDRCSLRDVDFRGGVKEFRRSYSNPTFGYRLRLPRRLPVYREPDPMPAHGIGIILSSEPRSYLFVDGSYNAALLPNVQSVADRDEGFVRNEATAVRRLSRTRTRLGSRPALRNRLEFACFTETFVTDEILLLRRDIVYTISLTTPKRRYRTDKRVLESIARSFRLRSPR